MRPIVKNLIKEYSEKMTFIEPIYEFGSYQFPGHNAFADMRPFFPGKEFIGADIRNGEGVDVVMDMCSTGLPDESVGTVLALDTLEHVEYLRKAMDELHRILKPEGMLIITSVMNCPIHDNHDYWRFTPEGFESLLKIFRNVKVQAYGDPKFPHTVVGIASKILILDGVIHE